MIIFIYGEDNFRSRKKLKELIERYREVNKKGLSLSCLDAKNIEFNDFKNELQQASIFNEKKLVVLNNAFSNQKLKENIIENIDSLTSLKNIIVFFEEGKIASNDSLLKVLTKKYKSQEFSLLKGEKLKKWIRDELSELKTEIDPKAVERLIDYVGSNLWQMDNELKKLASFKNRKKIEARDVEVLVKARVDADIFKTIDAIAEKNKAKAMILIQNHLEKGDNPLYLLSMISYQFRNLLIVKDLMEKGCSYCEISKTSNLKPFVLRKSLALAEKFSLSQLKKIYQNIFEVDLSIKTGKIKPETAFPLFLTEI